MHTSGLCYCFVLFCFKLNFYLIVIFVPFVALPCERNESNSELNLFSRPRRVSGALPLYILYVRGHIVGHQHLFSAMPGGMSRREIHSKRSDQRPTYVQLSVYPQKWLVKDTARRLRRRSSINLTNTFIHSEEKIQFNLNKYFESTAKKKTQC